MKKYIICLAALLGLGFTACEDVPAPYGFNTQQPDTPDNPDNPSEGVLIDAPLSSPQFAPKATIPSPSTVPTAT